MKLGCESGCEQSGEQGSQEGSQEGSQQGFVERGFYVIAVLIVRVYILVVLPSFFPFTNISNN